MIRRLRLLCCTVLLIPGASRVQPAEPTTPRKIEYTRDILPILSTHCFQCHGPDEKMRKAKLRLDVAAGATAELKAGRHAVVPGNVEKSALVDRIFADAEDRMPPARFPKQLNDAQKQLLKQWVAEGGRYQQHWSFVPPARPPVPALKNPGWVRNPIDAFILARLEAEGLQPSAEADRYTLARRAAIDLTGLPPSLEAVDRFVNDPRPDAYERFVDEMLASPSYGERWAQVWLDLARYADSNGYADDKPRSIWKYRDWVIDALNRNMPFDQFTAEQLAGDMLPKPSIDQIIATGFHRNTLTNDEGGTNDEEFRTAAVVDRVNTTAQVWMGLTMGCAQCHDHKYDPLSQEEYYKFYAILNQTEDADRGDDSPFISVLSPAQQQRKAELEKQVADLEAKLNGADAALDAAQQKWEATTAKDKLPKNVQGILAIEVAKRTPAQKTELLKYFRSIAPETKATRDQIAALKQQIAPLAGVTTLIMRELPQQNQRKTAILIRGNFLDRGKEVGPGTPAVLPALSNEKLDRLALAHWLTDPKHPLTGRVTVNRLWEQIFGIGLVETPDDFGIRGKLPSHPELLDWLATEYASHWDSKQMLKLIVTSATYRQSSRVTPGLIEKDPNNRLYARGPRFRSSAEVVRDQALNASGQLSVKMYGPPVRPPRPKLGLNAAFGGATDWEPSPGEDRYRRALYTLWRRTTPYPSMVAFDAPSRNVCTITRAKTNTPLQAFVTLNDPVYVEIAQALARRIVKEGGPSDAERAAYGFRLCVTRPPKDVELKRLIDLYQKTRAELSKNKTEATDLATVPLGPLPLQMDPVDLASWTVVSNVMLNLDELFMKR